jgi:tRNA (adenine57-N1/adenine58-N1)-methyltransferase
MSLTAQAGDLVQLQGSGFHSHLVRLEPGAVLQTHRGVIRHDDIIRQPWGCMLKSHTGQPFYLFQPGLADLIRETKRTTQILYPKDIGYILTVMGVGPGSQVLEIGTGSGGLTTAFAYMVGESGKVFTYERNPATQNLAVANLSKVGLAARVEFKLGDAAEGFSERGMDAAFMDLPNSFDYIPLAKQSLKGGGYLGMLVPTVNQVSRCLQALKQAQFACVEVCEIFMRFFKTDWERLRPTDRMVAHTGYLIFGRSVTQVLDDLFAGAEEEAA